MEAWYTTALEIEEVLAGAVDTHVHVFVADVAKSLDTVDGGFWTVCLAVLACLPGSVINVLNTMLVSGFAFSLLLVLVSLGLVTGVFLKAVF